MKNKFSVYALSDATAELSHNLAVAAVNQFPDHDCDIVRVPKITGMAQIERHVLRAKESHGVIVFTFVSAEMRQKILDLSKIHNVVAIDILGPALDALSNYFHKLPSFEPGLQYKLTRQYFQRTEAVEFTVKHDDGLGMATIAVADILLIGISRTSKTPLSIYLAYHGYRCANIPIVKDVPLPKVVFEMKGAKIVGLTINADKLAQIREQRLRKLGRPTTETYANIDYIREEIAYALRVFRELNVPVIDVTGKAIEETASEIISNL